jgi:hypothetical protein
MPGVVVGDTGTASRLTSIQVRQIPIDASAHSQDEEIGDVVVDSEAETSGIQTSNHKVIERKVRINCCDTDLYKPANGKVVGLVPSRWVMIKLPVLSEVPLKSVPVVIR